MTLRDAILKLRELGEGFAIRRGSGKESWLLTLQEVGGDRDFKVYVYAILVDDWVVLPLSTSWAEAALPGRAVWRNEWGDGQRCYIGDDGSIGGRLPTVTELREEDGWYSEPTKRSDNG